MQYEYGGQLMTRSSLTETGLAISYTRNALGQVEQAMSPEVTYVNTYDGANRLATVTDSRGNHQLQYEYTTGGRLRMRRQLDAGMNEVSRTDYVYDKVGRLSALWAGQGEMVSFVYDAGGRLTEQWLPTGVNTRYTYNADNTLQMVEHRSANGTQFGEHTYTYNNVGQREQAVHQDLTCNTTTTETMSYDAAESAHAGHDGGNGKWATTVNETESYTYDALNNRLAHTLNGNTEYYIYDAANQLLSIRQGSATGPELHGLSYDDNGNLETKTRVRTGR